MTVEQKSITENPIVNVIPYEQGSASGLMDFVCVVRNGSEGAAVSLHALKPNPAGKPIEIPKTTVNTADFRVGTRVAVAANYESDIILSYFPNGTVVKPDLALELQVYFAPTEERAGVSSTHATSDLPSLKLNIALQNPILNSAAQVAVSTDAAYPVLNTLNLLIHNPSDNPVIPFENSEELTPEDPLPPIDQSRFGPRLDRLYVYFPYGSTAGMLTTKELAAAITLSPAPDNLAWDVSSTMSGPDIGPYWILFPKSDYFMDPNESVRFVLTGIRTFNPSGSLTHMNLKKQVTNYEVETDRDTGLSLIDAPPKIVSFRSSEKSVPAGTNIQLSWTTWNAKTCSLGNIEGLPANQKSFSQRPVATTNYKLQAFSPTNLSIQQFEQVEVQPVAIKSFTAEPSEGLRIGEPVRLTWETSSAVTVRITPDVGEVCIDASGCNTGERIVYPLTRTTYTLEATGEGGPKASTLTVFPLPRGWGDQTVSAPWSTRDRPTLLAFQNKLWFMAGGTEVTANPIYSSFDGASWTIANANAPWSLRTFTSGVTFTVGGTNSMWLLGGDDAKGQTFNDVWSTAQADGHGWKQILAAAPWSARSQFGCLVFQNKIWIFGGWNGRNVGYNDVWNSENGIDWIQMTASARWSPRWGFGTAVFDNRLWIFAGQTAPESNQVTREVWSSADGVTWEEAAVPSWGGRRLPAVQTIGGATYVCGGIDAGGSVIRDLQRMTIVEEDKRKVIKWSQLVARQDAAALGSVAYLNAIWLAGGWKIQEGARSANRRVWVYAP